MLAKTTLNEQAIVLEEAEALIRKTVREEYFKRTNKNIINKKIEIIIKTATNKISIPNLKRLAIISLANFYRRQYLEISKLSNVEIGIITVLNKLSNGKSLAQEEISLLTQQGILVNYDKVNVPRQNLFGVPLQKFSDDYFKQNVNPVIERLSKQYPYDPESETSQTRYINSLRSRAELEVRYNEHISQIDYLKKSGTKLVIASTHADCSERCAPFQGRVYSLDGTSGKTDDGRQYVPLETATDVFYTTKSGKTYKNGLLGFNCRHFLIPYKGGYKFPKPNVQEERKQYAITVKQRELERNVREWRTRAVEYKGLDEKEYLKAKEKAIEWNNAYIEFSKQNKRAYYPSRTKII